MTLWRHAVVAAVAAMALTGCGSDDGNVKKASEVWAEEEAKAEAAGETDDTDSDTDGDSGSAPSGAEADALRADFDTALPFLEEKLEGRDGFGGSAGSVDDDWGLTTATDYSVSHEGGVATEIVLSAGDVSLVWSDDQFWIEQPGDASALKSTTLAQDAVTIQEAINTWLQTHGEMPGTSSLGEGVTLEAGMFDDENSAEPIELDVADSVGVKESSRMNDQWSATVVDEDTDEKVKISNEKVVIIVRAPYAE